MNKTFEEYLQDRCFEENPTVLDDAMSDCFDAWLGEQDVSSIMIYADGWMNQTKCALQTEIRNILN
jgi:hypothetical protein